MKKEKKDIGIYGTEDFLNHKSLVPFFFCRSSCERAAVVNLPRRNEIISRALMVNSVQFSCSNPRTLQVTVQCEQYFYFLLVRFIVQRVGVNNSEIFSCTWLTLSTLRF